MIPWSRKKERKKEIKDFLEFNENEDTTNPNQWNTIKIIAKRKTHSPECL